MLGAFTQILSKIYSQKYFPIFITSLILLVSLIGIASLNYGNIYQLELDNVSLRHHPATNSPALMTINNQSKIHILNEENGWFKVLVDGNQEGYIPQWLIDSKELVNDQDLSAVVNKSTSLLSQPDANAPEVISINSGEYISINFEENGWAEVEYKNNLGYLPTHTLKLIHSKNIPLDIQEQIAQEEIQRQYDEDFEKLDKIVYARQDNGSLFVEPDIWSDIMYTPDYNQEFQLIEIVDDENGMDDFYFVEDQEGKRGYLETRIAARASEYLGHIGTTSPGSIDNATIVIDPGHGGDDPGAISHDGMIYEKDITLSTALKLQEELEKYGANVILTRNTDEWVEIDDRPIVSNEIEADAFLSLHFDAIDDPNWHGTTTYYFHESDYDLAQNINNYLENLPLPNNYVNFGNYLVIRENNRPSILLELGYMSSENDLPYIRNSQYHQAVAEAISQGLFDYFNQ